MSGGRKISKDERRRRQKQRQKERCRPGDEDVVKDTAAVFTCSTETASDFAGQCDRRRDDIEVDLVFSGLALEIWKRSGRSEQLTAILEDLVAEQRRNLEVIAALERRFIELQVANGHDHLDPPEHYRHFVRQWLFPADVAADA